MFVKKKWLIAVGCIGEKVHANLCHALAGSVIKAEYWTVIVATTTVVKMESDEMVTSTHLFFAS